MLQLDEELITLTQAARDFPVKAQKPHVSTVVRWSLRGVGKGRVKLETVMIGGRRYTSRAALLRFVARLSGEAVEKENLSRERTEAIERAGRELDADDIS